MIYRALNLYRRDRSENNRMNMVHRRSEYQDCIRKAKFMYNNSKTNTLLLARHKNARLYWQMLKYSCGIKNNSISQHMIETYFKAVNCPDDPIFLP